MNAKRYVYGMLFCVVLFLGFHWMTWTLWSKHVLLLDDMTYKGDLARLTYKKDSILERPSYLNPAALTLPRRHLQYKELQPGEGVDVVTLGDSFSNAATQGKNPFYQDYIATYNDMKVLNVIPFRSTLRFIEPIVQMYNSGLLQELSPKAVLIQSVERFAAIRFARKIDFTQTAPLKQLRQTLRKQKNIYVGKDENIKFINNRNMDAFIYNMTALFNPYSNSLACYVRPMEKDFFTTEDPNSLLYHKDDILHLPKATPASVKKLNENFNTLADMLAQEGIELYFMPVVDKYDLYAPYIIGNTHPKSRFFELLRPLKKRYRLIDTKKMLRKELEKGVKDLYYPGDTHWSYKASKTIFKKVRF